MFVIGKQGKSISDKALPAEYANLKEIDKDYYINHQLLPAGLRILSVFGLKQEDFGL
jgi:DNA polymerase I